MKEILEEHSQTSPLVLVTLPKMRDGMSAHGWLISVDNLLVFTALFLIFCIVIGIILAIFLDQKIRAEGVLRTIYLS